METKSYRGVARLLLVVTVVSILAAFAAMPALADQQECLSGRFCSWKNANFGGSRLDETHDNNSLIPEGFHDNISAAWNRTSNTFSLDQHVDCDGLFQSFSAGVADSQVNRNDDASSIDDWSEVACS